MARNGKIAKLPLSIREELNIRILDGQPASKILPWLNALPEVKACCEEDFEGILINDGNLSEWRKGGFVEWERKRDRIGRTRELAKYSVELAKASGGNLSEGAAAVLSGQILEILEGVDDLRESGPGPLTEGNEGNEGGKARMVELAEALEGLTLSVSRLRKGDHDAQTIRQNDERLEQNDRVIELNRERFETLACEKFADWRANSRAVEIVDSDLPRAEKIKELRQLMFGELGKRGDSETLRK